MCPAAVYTTRPSLGFLPIFMRATSPNRRERVMLSNGRQGLCTGERAAMLLLTATRLKCFDVSPTSTKKKEEVEEERERERWGCYIRHRCNTAAQLHQ